jgi:hypothetical protein
MSFKFGNAIFNTFEMPWPSYLMSVGKFTFCCYSVHLLQNQRSLEYPMDYGRPMKPFFIEIQNFGLGQTNWTDNFWGIWGTFSQTIRTHFGTASPLSMFSIIQPLFLKKKSAFISTSQIFIWDWDLNLNLGRKELGI